MSDRVALVTGGSRGIGRATCLRLADLGWSVAVNFRTNGNAAEETVGAIRSAGREAVAVEGDVTDPDAVAAMFLSVERELGDVGVLVNNAGIRRDGLTARMSSSQWDEVVGTNLSGAFLCARQALRSMIRRNRGRIVNVSSVAGLLGSAGQANYAAAKAGLLGLTRSLARETGRANVTVNAVAPGLIATDLTADLSPEQERQLVDRIPARRLGTPEEVAGLIAWLCSDEADYVNGAVITIDGGMAA